VFDSSGYPHELGTTEQPAPAPGGGVGELADDDVGGAEVVDSAGGGAASEEDVIGAAELSSLVDGTTVGAVLLGCGWLGRHPLGCG
jgi:hypothetical protein